MAVRYGLAMLVDADSHPLRLGSIHRSIAGLPCPRRQPPPHEGFAPSRSCRPSSTRSAFCPRPATPDQHWFSQTVGTARCCDTRSAIGSRLCPPAGGPGRGKNLDATIAYEFLLPRLFGVDDADRRVTYHHEARAALDRARRLGGVALLLKPASHDDVLAVAAAGERMPRKSTSFGPKPRTGLLMRLLTEFAVPGPRQPPHTTELDFVTALRNALRPPEPSAQGAVHLNHIARPPPQQRPSEGRNPARTRQRVDLLTAAMAGRRSGPLDHEADADHAVAAGQREQHRIGRHAAHEMDLIAVLEYRDRFGAHEALLYLDALDQPMVGRRSLGETRRLRAVDCPAAADRLWTAAPGRAP